MVASPFSASLFPMDPDGVKGFCGAGNQARLTEAVHSGGRECKCHRVLRTDGPRRLREPISKQSSAVNGAVRLTIGAAVENGLFKVRAASAAECTAPAFSSYLCSCVTAGSSNLTEPPVCSALKVP